MLRVALLLLAATASLADWQYTEEANTLDGAPCMADCMSGKCVVNWAGMTRECTKTGAAAPKFHTSKGEVNDGYCLSNCGYFGYEYLWCVTGAGGEEGPVWDYCNPSTEQQSMYGSRCAGRCTRRAGEYAYCVTEQGASQRCAFPAIPGKNNTV